jgi:hypothetical protein
MREKRGREKHAHLQERDGKAPAFIQRGRHEPESRQAPSRRRTRS